MAVLKKRFKLHGQPYDELLFNYINGTTYPNSDEWNLLNDVISDIKCFTRDKFKFIVPCKLYRGTDYDTIANASLGQVLDFTNRYYSWSDKYSVAKQVAGYNGTVLITEGDIQGIDLRRVNNLQSEILIPPTTFKVINREYSDSVFMLHLVPISTIIKDLL